MSRCTNACPSHDLFTYNIVDCYTGQNRVDMSIATFEQSMDESFRTASGTASDDLGDSQLQADLLTLLQAWHGTEMRGNPLGHLCLFRNNRLGRQTEREAIEAVIHQAVTHLSAEDPQDADLIQRRFLDKQTAQSVANQLCVSLGHYYRIQKRAISRLAETIVQMERAAQRDFRASLKRVLEPPTYFGLVGVEAELDALSARITAPGPPWLFSIEGLGGMGKTSLANEVARRTIDLGCWEGIAWVTARQNLFNLGGGITPVEQPALTVTELVRTLLQQLGLADENRYLSSSDAAQAALMQRLTEREHLIIIDNLETVADLHSLLPMLRQLANPTRFLLTSRESLRHEPDVSRFVVPPLSERDALQLIRQEATRNHLPDFASADDADLKPLFDLVGGNPLALRLLMGQLHLFSLPDLLTNFTAQRSEAAESLYTYVYRQIWDQLDEPARLTLLAMPLVCEQGGTLDLLRGITHMEPAELSRALTTLVRLNLVDSHGGIHERHFSIHGLTRAFLQEQVAQWS